MAKRDLFKLPGIQDLSKDQEDGRALPKNGQHLIIGGPGTGKSVLALLRARRHHEDDEDYVFLIYNHLLNQASCLLFGKALSSKQWMSWFMSTFRKMTGEPFPTLPPRSGSTWKEIDWDGGLAIIGDQSLPSVNGFPYLVIDEGQDMPPQFYQALANLGFENFFVVADQNQQIVPDKNSTRRDIENVLAIDTADVIELQDNYRNSHAIARLARCFYTGDPASPPPKLPVAVATASKRPMLVDYQPDAFQKIIGRILKISDNDRSKLIGVIAPNNKVRERYFKELMNANVELVNGRPNITTFASGDGHEMAFDEGGVMVINAQACKGLEFDTVVLADIDKYHCNPKNQNAVRRLFYVMVARAIDQVIMLKEAGSHCPVDAILPKEPDVLERK
jgi:DNA helicase-2/ATP-dependent DNA helicase PcrA